MAKYEDAMLMMQLMRWGEESGAMAASMEMMMQRAGGQEPTADDATILKILMLGETIGTFTKQGVLDTDLVNDLMATGWMWSIVRESALAQRAQSGEPRLWENFEALATG